MITPEALTERFIPFSSLRYASEAFIDYCIPGCKPKFNYALIGPGVSQNPNQPVSLREHHGFQVGGVSMPHGKTNPPHMHFTCEVFICTKGDWRIEWGFNPERSDAMIGEGDLVSVPTWVYRGFTNLGVDDGFLFTALGGDNTGGILWGPSTLVAAADQGVLLTEDYRIVDTTRGDALRPGERQLQPMSDEDIAALDVWPLERMAARIVRQADLKWSTHGFIDSALPGGGAQLAAAVGLGVVEDRRLQAPVSNAHGVSIEWLRVPPGGTVSRHRLAEKQVFIVKQGRLELNIDSTTGPTAFTLHGHANGWDSFAMPGAVWRSLRNPGDDEALVLLMTAGDHRKRIEWDAGVLAAAAAAGWAHDANGFVADKRVVERAQR